MQDEQAIPIEVQIEGPIDERTLAPIKRGPSFADPMIVIDLKVYQQIMYWVQAAPGEVSWFGRAVKKVREINGVANVGQVEDWHIIEVRLFEQECSSGYTHIDGEVLSRFVVELAKEGKDHSKWNHWGHSHSDFDVFMSGIDDRAAWSLSKVNPCLSVVFNRYGQMHGRIDHGFIQREMLATVRPLDTHSAKRIKSNQQIKDKVKEFVYVRPRAIKRLIKSGQNGGTDGFAYRGGSRGKFHGPNYLQDGYWYD